MYDMAIERGFRLLSNGIRHVMPSTDRRLELKEKTSMAQNAWQASVYANGLKLQYFEHFFPPYTFLFSALHIQNNTGQNGVKQGLMYVRHLYFM